ncbi:MAG: ribonuclease III [Patescibacteria group bacterium]
MAITDAHKKARATFEERAGISFKNSQFIETAFTHRSYINEARSGGSAASTGEHNERLEFLGDAVLELAVTDHLFRNYPESNEGDLTNYRAALVNAVMLGGIAEKLGVNDCLLLSKGESRDLGRARATILANTFEAIVGALYMDQGYEAASDFINRHVISHMPEVLATGAWRDAKSEFQEFAQAKYGMTPKYETVRAEGPDHDKRFVISLSVGEVQIAEGEGKSKQEAEQDAARKALKEKD